LTVQFGVLVHQRLTIPLSDGGEAQFRTGGDADLDHFCLQCPWHDEGGVPGVIDTLEINMRLISPVIVAS